MSSTTADPESTGLSQSEPTGSREELGKALGRVASGVFVVTYQTGLERQGMLTTWIAQAGFEPPLLTVAINKQRPLLKHLKPGAVFTINILAKANTDVFKAFTQPAQTEESDRFAQLDVQPNPAGGPVFSQSVSYLNCRIVQLIDTSDHVVALAEVVFGRLLQADAEPMTHVRKSGFQY